jgi:hypothetical protein
MDVEATFINLDADFKEDRNMPSALTNCLSFCDGAKTYSYYNAPKFWKSAQEEKEPCMKEDEMDRQVNNEEDSKDDNLNQARKRSLLQ